MRVFDGGVAIDPQHDEIFRQVIEVGNRITADGAGTFGVAVVGRGIEEGHILEHFGMVEVG